MRSKSIISYMNLKINYCFSPIRLETFCRVQYVFCNMNNQSKLYFICYTGKKLKLRCFLCFLRKHKTKYARKNDKNSAETTCISNQLIYLWDFFFQNILHFRSGISDFEYKLFWNKICCRLIHNISGCVPLRL